MSVFEGVRMTVVVISCPDASVVVSAEVIDDETEVRICEREVLELELELEEDEDKDDEEDEDEELEDELDELLDDELDELEDDELDDDVVSVPEALAVAPPPPGPWRR